MKVFDSKHGVRTIDIKELKTEPRFFQAQADGLKNFEIRKKDRDYQVGDVLVLKEYNSNTGVYTGRKIHCLITYITTCEQKPNYVVLGTKRI